MLCSIGLCGGGLSLLVLGELYKEQGTFFQLDFSVGLHAGENVLIMTAYSALFRIHRRRFIIAEKGVTADPPWGPVEVLLLANDRVAIRVTLGRILHVQDMQFAVQ